MRPVEFERQAVLVKAMNCFWLHGYQASSMALLLKTMGISRSSFYNSFADKQQLYCECLTLYVDQILTVWQLLEKQHSGINLLRQFFLFTLTGQSFVPLQQGCLLVSSVSEFSGVDQGLHQQVLQQFNRVKQQWQRALENAAVNDPEVAVEWLASLLMGWRLQGQAGLSSELLARQINWSFDQMQMT
ncbi:TetR/AcrR family transcriptional regulator [Bacterioplanoides sp.]|uniref:TetR/AcrR family transcriptional regulator n=1 Tax=Bacterioplanoides sp. TaxID=2066072 RepID=UPI003AFF7D10